MNINAVIIILAFVCSEVYYSAGIFSGTRAVKGQYPFIVRIFNYFFNRKDSRIFLKFTCTGSIVNKDFVLTSAGCLQHLINHHKKKDNTDLIKNLTWWDQTYFRAGIIDGDAGEGRDEKGFQETRGILLIVHPDYRNQSTMFDVDVALIKIKPSWDFTRDPKQVAPVPKWGQRIKELDWLKCFVAGFGYTTQKEYKDDIPTVRPEMGDREEIDGNILRYYKSQVGRERYCKFLRKNLGLVKRVKGEVFDDFYACALPVNATVTPGPCYGDIGAPLICSGIVTGVMSQIRSKRPICDVRGVVNNTAFAVFTSVGAEEVINFIRKHVPDFPELVEVPPGDPFDD